MKQIRKTNFPCFWWSWLSQNFQSICLAKLHNIIILCLPPHTTYMLQPLDVKVFGPFQHDWLDHCNSIVELTGSEMPKEDFMKEYMQVREGTFHPSTIISAFKKSGAWPVDNSVFTEDDFATSIPYSTEACNFPSLDLNPSNHNSDNQSEADSNSESDSNSDLEPQSHHPQPQISHLHPMLDHSHCSSMSTPTPTPSTLPTTLPATKSHYSVNSLPTQISPLPPIPTTQFYHDPVLFEQISYLEANMKQLNGQVKMV